ncbi:MAG: CBS domain-containing protein [Armatimonadetes bacterium]|nr:CBS domain-containing protein [Armatimonadota bacterium]
MQIIISHQNADFDALSSMAAASKLYPQAKLYFTSSPEQNVRDFMVLYQKIIKINYPKGIDKLSINKLIIVDCRAPNRLGEFKDLVNNPQIEVDIYDHHPATYESIIGDRNIIKNYGATITILVKKIKEKKIFINPIEATLFALGIYEETGSLTFSSTTKEDIETAAYLLNLGANLKIVSRFIHHSLNKHQRNLLSKLLQSSKIYNIHSFKVLITKAKISHYIEELALITHRIMDLEQLDIILSIVLMKEKTYIIGRSALIDFDLNNVLADFGGGGHPQAASAVVKNKDLGKIEEELLKTLKNTLKPKLTAQEIMSAPVRYIDLKEEPKMEDAKNAFLRYGYSSLIITQDKKLKGIISRTDVDKAIQHKFNNAPLKFYMTKKLVTAAPDTSLEELQSLMQEHNLGKIPILKQKKIFGIVTRSDILKALHQINLKIQSPFIVLENLNKLPYFIQKILKHCGKIADKLNLNVYAVGGFVRDLLLGVENLDIDLVVEGDGIFYAQELAKSLKAKIKTHEKFKTALIFLKNFKIDIASSRIEFYTRPAALPEVLGSSLKQDLYRRDFTINAMAINLNQNNFGKLIDFFGGRKDLKQGIVRVLHNLSFIDDPTRIFRAIRFEKRYQFKMDYHTESLLKNALRIKIFNSLTNERIREEIILILSELKPIPAIKRMEELKILKLIHPDIHLYPKIIEILEKITNLLIQYQQIIKEEKIKSWLIYFLALISQIEIKQIQEIVKKYKVSKQEMNKLSFDKQKIANIFRSLINRDLTNSEIYRLLENLPLEVIFYLIARTNFLLIKQRINNYLIKFRKFKFLIKGADLIKWGYSPSKFYKDALKYLQNCQLNGLIKTKKDAKNLLKEYIRNKGI